MPAVFPLICFLLIFLASYKSSSRPDWRACFLCASLIWGVLLAVITEALSILNSISFAPVLGSWLLAVSIVLLIFLRVKNPLKMIAGMDEIPKFWRGLILSQAVIIGIIGFIALISPPNNWDSMTYHMGRVVHWIQNQSVAHYPTHILRQLHQNPWAEFAIMHFQILAGGDRLANLVQWFSLIGGILGVSLIAQELGADRKGQVLAAIFCGTIPIGILQGSSTQNDLVVSFWLVCMVYSILLLVNDDQRLWLRSLGAGAGLGLAVLTKGTAYIYAFPFLVWLVLPRLKGPRLAPSLKSLVLVGAVGLSINSGHYYRNFQLYDMPLGPSATSGESEFDRYANDIVSVPAALSNVVRNMSLHIGTTSARLDYFEDRGIHWIHKVIGFDINDRRTTWMESKFQVQKLSIHEDIAGNPFHFVLILLAVPLFFLIRPINPSSKLVYFAIATSAAFLLFCVVLKWQPWHSRLQLPLFVLWSAFIGTVLGRLPNARIPNAIAVALLAAAVPWVVHNESRPLLGERSILTADRMDQYFSNRPRLRDAYQGAVGFLQSRNCTVVGFHFMEDHWEYPFWQLFKNGNGQPPRIEHFAVKNISGTKMQSLSDFKPCGVISLGSGRVRQMRSEQKEYREAWSMAPVFVFVKE